MPRPAFTEAHISAAAEAGHSLVHAYLHIEEHGTDDHRFPSWDRAADAIKNAAIARVRSFLEDGFAGEGAESIEDKLFRIGVEELLEAFFEDGSVAPADPEPEPAPVVEVTDGDEPPPPPPPPDGGGAPAAPAATVVPPKDEPPVAPTA